jgi:N-acetylneuraminic acid mutarotase
MRLGKRAATLSILTTLGLTLALAMPAPAALAQAGTWSELAPVPSLGPGVEGMAVGVINGKIIAAFGFDPGSKVGDTKTTRIYNPGTNTWTVTSPPAPGGERSEAGAVVVGSKLYVAGGGDRQGVKDNLTVYDASAGTWTGLAVLPLVPKGHNGKMKPDKKAGLALASANGFLYAIGGRDTPDGPCSPKTNAGILSTVDRYNISTDTWDFAAPMTGAVAARSDLAAVTINNQIWVFGGCDVSKNGAIQLSKEVDMYDPGTDTWTKEPNLPDGACAFGQVVAIGTTVYVIGGYFGTKAPPGNEVWAYDTLTGSTDTSFATMPTARSSMGVVVYNGSIYTVGGSIPAFGNSTNANEKFTP